MSTEVDAIVAKVKALPPEEQLEVAEAIDRLTWAERWRRVCERIEQHNRGKPLPSDEDIHKAVQEVRREKSLTDRFC